MRECILSTSKRALTLKESGLTSKLSNNCLSNRLSGSRHNTNEAVLEAFG